MMIRAPLKGSWGILVGFEALPSDRGSFGQEDAESESIRRHLPMYLRTPCNTKTLPCRTLRFILYTTALHQSQQRYMHQKVTLNQGLQPETLNMLLGRISTLLLLGGSEGRTLRFSSQRLQYIRV